MKITKDLIIVALATFCLTATIFMVVPTKSGSGSDYYQWADLDDNGKVDILDAISLANAFGTSGDPTKNVNVTNPRTKVIQTDVNISVIDSPGPHGIGGSITDAFETEGFDRMFVSAALIDVSEYNGPNWITIDLSGVYWHWGIINGTEMKTYNAVDSDRTARIDIGSTDEIPVSSESSAEIAVRAPKCSLSFFAITWYTRAWLLVRVSIYLSLGTTSPPSVQNTNVMNWPEPAPQTYFLDTNTSISNGHGIGAIPVETSGYSRMFVSLFITTRVLGTTVSLNSVYWDPFGGHEYVAPGTLNATYDGSFNSEASRQPPAEFIVKGRSCMIYFNVTTGFQSGWLEFEAIAYLRNE
jgi:hypothetical protein